MKKQTENTRTLCLNNESEVYLYFSRRVAERVISRIRLYGCAGQKLNNTFFRVILDSNVPSFF
jgi:hypothetical protein